MPNSIFRFPGVLILLSANFKPATQLVPKKLHAPVSSVTKPIFTGGFSCADPIFGVSANAAPAISSARHACLRPIINSPPPKGFIVGFSLLELVADDRPPIVGSGGVTLRLGIQQAGPDQGCPDPLDLGRPKLEEGR